MTDCVFCRIAAKKIPASMVYEDEHTLAFMDVGQVNPGHVLVAARTHVENVYALDDELASAVFRTAARIARAVRTAFDPHGLNLFQANVQAGGLTVSHFHLHVLPRWHDDGMKLVWPVKNPSRDTLQSHAEKLRAALV